MDIVTVNGHEAIKCVHCNGSGICGHAIWAYSGNANSPGSTMYCPKCGMGSFYYAKVGLFRTTYVTQGMQRPVCSVCGGTGHVVIK